MPDQTNPLAGGSLPSKEDIVRVYATMDTEELQALHAVVQIARTIQMAAHTPDPTHLKSDHVDEILRGLGLGPSPEIYRHLIAKATATIASSADLLDAVSQGPLGGTLTGVHAVLDEAIISQRQAPDGPSVLAPGHPELN